MDGILHLIHLDPATWGLLASIVTVVVGIPTIIGIIRHQAKEHADSVNVATKADVTNTNTFEPKFEPHIHVSAPQVNQWPTQPPAVPPASPLVTEQPLPPSSPSETPPVSLKQSSPLSDTPLETASSVPEVLASSDVPAVPVTPHYTPETLSPPPAPDEPVPVAPTPNSDPGVTYFQNVGARDQVETPHVQPSPTAEEPKAGVEPAPTSGKLAADHIARRASLRAMLRHASYLVQEVRVYADKARDYTDKYGSPSQSDPPYHTSVLIHRALLSYLEATQGSVSRLNAALNKLSSIEWLNGDPRGVFFAATDPFSVGTPSEVRQSFRDTLEALAKQVRDMGYTVIRREEPFDPHYRNGQSIYYLTAARNPKLESFDVQDDEREEVDDEALEDEMSDDA